MLNTLPTRRSSDLLGQRTKKERRQAYIAADENDPIALVVALAEAEKAETDAEKKMEISDLRQFVLDNIDAFRDYRDIIKEKDRSEEHTSELQSRGHLVC